ncbi:predicted protein [Naegleria gruberi]|uniref:Predicted protein n=1 Tax=Naegleria gruberi TaxID=5762 RepID=D2VQG8_NAEGR|nr:uncharacterized protein NAEGRDRAFT_80870 [Naegleria gruberi]EFC40946.1 predicted protein [Naegleria gruberi]|eukprot:XP_002673690.1 predicted protein [Naegleria gruberi strain NEG-M]
MNQLPEEIIAEIFSFLHAKFVFLITSQVCKRWLVVRRLVHLRLKFTSKQEFSKLLLDHQADDYYFSIKKFSAVGCHLTDSEIERVCSSMNANALEYLSLRRNEFSSSGLKLIIDKFSKLKSLDVREYTSNMIINIC